MISLRRGSVLAARILVSLIFWRVFMSVLTADVSVGNQATILSFGFDSSDYDAIAQSMADDIALDERASSYRGKVMTLGPIDDQETPYFFDTRTFQESLRTRLFRSELFEFSIAVDAIDQISVQEARSKVRYFDWLKKGESDEQLMHNIRDLYDVDYILFGRVTSQLVQRGQAQEVTHRFNWSIGNCETGVIVWTKEIPVTKVGDYHSEDPPDWARYPRKDSAAFVYQVGYSPAGDSAEASLNEAKAMARRELAGRFDHHLLSRLDLFDSLGMVTGRMHPVDWKASHGLWVLFKMPRADMTLIEEKLSFGAEMDAEWEYLQANASSLDLDDCWERIHVLLSNYPDCLMKSVGLAQLQLSAAEFAVKLKKAGSAYDLLLEASKHAVDSDTKVRVQSLRSKLPRPSNLWLLRKNYVNHAVEIIATYRSDSDVKPFRELKQQLTESFVAAEFEVLEEGRNIVSPLGFDELLAQSRHLSSLKESPRLTVILEYRKGAGKPQKLNLGGFLITRATPDSEVQFVLYDSLSDGVVGSGVFSAEVKDASLDLATSLTRQWIDSRVLPSL